MFDIGTLWFFKKTVQLEALYVYSNQDRKLGQLGVNECPSNTKSAMRYVSLPNNRNKLYEGQPKKPLVDCG